MSFAVDASAYDRFMGRFSAPLAEEFVRMLDLEQGWRALDVGSGPGALTLELSKVLGESNTVAVDPSESFVAALRESFPGVEAAVASADDLPFEDGAFDVSAAELVVHFMPDPVAGIREMGRVTRRNGVVGACVWDFGGDRAPLAPFWRAVGDLDPDAPNESERAGTHRGDLERLFAEAGLRDIRSEALIVTVEFASFDAWWEPFTLGVGPAGAYVAALDERRRAELVRRCADLLPSAPFSIESAAWAVVGRA
jgi:SAM-dependent methyltransferase